MDPTPKSWFFLSVLLSSILLSASQSLNTSLLDSVIRDYAFEALIKRRTGVTYHIPLPVTLSGITASVIRLRSGSLWSRGSDSNQFHIPTKIITVPFARRLVVVYQDLGNWSSSYYSVPGYELVAPIVGCLAYEFSNTSSAEIRELTLRSLGDPISILFPDLFLKNGTKAKCARFGSSGSVHLVEMDSPNVCSSTVTGHFTVVAPLRVEPALAPSAPMERGERRWRVWVIVCGGGVVGLLMAGLIGIGIIKFLRNKRIEEMEKRGEGGEALGNVWVGSSVMPSATMARTKPALESEHPPL